MNRYDPRQMAQPHGPAMSLPVPHGGLMAPGSGGGGIVRIIPKLTYAPFPAASETEEIVLAKYVDTTLWVTGVLVVRVHAASVNAGQDLKVKVQATSFAEEDPASDFVYSSAHVASVSITTTTSPKLLLDTFTAYIGGQVRVILEATQDGDANEGMSCTIGIDLVGRQA